MKKSIMIQDMQILLRRQRIVQEEINKAEALKLIRIKDTSTNFKRIHRL
jgi:hypothetical protein